MKRLNLNLYRKVWMPWRTKLISVWSGQTVKKMNLARISPPGNAPDLLAHWIPWVRKCWYVAYLRIHSSFWWRWTNITKLILWHTKSKREDYIWMIQWHMIWQHSWSISESDFCPAVFDGFLCWPKTPAGSTVELPCPKGVAGLDDNSESKIIYRAWQIIF